MAPVAVPVAAAPAPPRPTEATSRRSLWPTFLPALLRVAVAFGGSLRDWLAPQHQQTGPIDQPVDSTPRLEIRYHDVTQNDVLDNLYLPDHQATMRFGLVMLQKGKEVGTG